ncbi:T9SS type A sorting domain-containing protein [Flavobacterium zepuense]|uniref:T9SS type A sorting domain-containing protein n=1 Tax=Flavobacterium zepuense TaxID=2593302 RepID=A0A552V9U3_9FLAO|nr:T9SS type A sorting domain-containing protein [Flavobacterium zepuense]TRW27238.1 T9SS type A sorting domain-containing protein [Flavobacterium zepuense]
MKNFLLFTLFLFCLQANAQFTVWEDDFNDGNVTDWTLQDEDANTSNWLARKNLFIDTNTGEIGEGSADVLATYNIDLATGYSYENIENNWAISPVQDLSYYGGTLQLVINAQTTAYDGTGASQSLLVYVSNSPDMATFLENEPITLNLTRTTQNAEEFHEYIVDMSQYAGEGQEEVYFAIVKNAQPFTGIEINDVKITATGLAGVDEVTKSFTKIKQNPVTETLELQLAPNVDGNTLNVSIYNINGILVSESKYNETGISVSGLAGGMYFAVLNNGEASQQLKFIKK